MEMDDNNNNNNDNNNDDGGYEYGLEAMKISSDHLDPQLVEAELIRNGFLDPSLGIQDRRSERDPMHAILFTPTKVVSLKDGQQVILIDDLIRSAHAECSRNYGDLYTNFEMIQNTVNNLLASSDTHAKQLFFLVVFAIEKGLQDHLCKFYPPNDSENQYARRRLIETFVPAIIAQMEETLNTAYVNVPAPNQYNVSTMLEAALGNIIAEYE